VGNVYPAEVANALVPSAVAEAAVLACPSERGAKTVCAVVYRSGPCRHLKKLTNHCRKSDRQLQGAQIDSI